MKIEKITRLIAEQEDCDFEKAYRDFWTQKHMPRCKIRNRLCGQKAKDSSWMNITGSAKFRLGTFINVNSAILRRVGFRVYEPNRSPRQE
jgi:hypothetical protein